MTITDRIRELERENSTLVARVDNLKRDIERVEKSLDDISTHRWEILKIVIAAVVGAILATAGFFAKGVLDQRAGVERAAPPVPLPNQKP